MLNPFAHGELCLSYRSHRKVRLRRNGWSVCRVVVGFSGEEKGGVKAKMGDGSKEELVVAGAVSSRQGWQWALKYYYLALTASFS